MTDAEFDHAIRCHDKALAALGLAIWSGTEPTFTDRFSESPAWLSAALGDDKEKRAEALLRGLQRHFGGAVLRTVGRQYPGEDRPRWNLGLYDRRDRTAPRPAPLDPALSEGELADFDPGALQSTLSERLAAAGYETRTLSGTDGSLRVVAGDRSDPAALAADDARLQRPALHRRTLPDAGPVDTLAEDGYWLFIVARSEWQERPVPHVEVPGCDDPERYLAWLRLLHEAASDAGLAALVLTGYPPPVDERVVWTTITPDPAVIEINMAPYPEVAGLLAASRTVYRAAAEVGLAPFRLHYNGTLVDSGGGGQITLGGSSPRHSPFIRDPRLLPRLLRYTNHHPSLSYYFCHDYVGSSGQAVRTDESGHDALHELGLALALLEDRPALDPEALWAGLAQCLTDAAGNTHRSEINIEKLWNPYLVGRGQLGLVEFRALRMQHTPEQVAALAALLRTIVARLAVRDFDTALCDWGEELHERFALPYYLERDFEAVLDDLRTADLALPEPLVEELQDDDYRHWASVRHAGCELTIRRGIEFWPLIGDVSTLEQGPSRLIDSSTSRLELCLRPLTGGAEEDFAGWQIAAENTALPMRLERDARGPAKVFGLRYRSFLPWQGLHPTLEAHSRLHLTLFHPQRPGALNVTLYDWRPDQAPYADLPIDLAEAAQRRTARCVARETARPSDAKLAAPRAEALTPYSLDLRWPARPGRDDPRAGDR